MTIDELNALTTLTAADEVPVWDSEESGEPTKKITASNLAASVKSLGSLIGTGDLDSTPTQGSNKAVTSGGTYTAIQQSTATVNAYDGSAVGSALNGTTIDGTSAYTRCRRKAGWVFMKIRIKCSTISSDRTAVLSLVDDLRPVADIPYVWARNEWNQSIQGQCTISYDGKVYAMANCSEKDLTIWAVYPGL